MLLVGFILFLKMGDFFFFKENMILLSREVRDGQFRFVGNILLYVYAIERF